MKRRKKDALVGIDGLTDDELSDNEINEQNSARDPSISSSINPTNTKLSIHTTKEKLIYRNFNSRFKNNPKELPFVAMDSSPIKSDLHGCRKFTAKDENDQDLQVTEAATEGKYQYNIAPGGDEYTIYKVRIPMVDAKGNHTDTFQEFVLNGLGERLSDIVHTDKNGEVVQNIDTSFKTQLDLNWFDGLQKAEALTREQKIGKGGSGVNISSGVLKNQGSKRKVSKLKKISTRNFDDNSNSSLITNTLRGGGRGTLVSRGGGSQNPSSGTFSSRGSESFTDSDNDSVISALTDIDDKADYRTLQIRRNKNQEHDNNSSYILSNSSLSDSNNDSDLSDSDSDISGAKTTSLFKNINNFGSNIAPSASLANRKSTKVVEQNKRILTQTDSFEAPQYGNGNSNLVIFEKELFRFKIQDLEKKLLNSETEIDKLKANKRKESGEKVDQNELQESDWKSKLNQSHDESDISVLLECEKAMISQGTKEFPENLINEYMGILVKTINPFIIAQMPPQGRAQKIKDKAKELGVKFPESKKAGPIILTDADYEFYDDIKNGNLNKAKTHVVRLIADKKEHLTNKKTKALEYGLKNIITNWEDIYNDNKKTYNKTEDEYKKASNEQERIESLNYDTLIKDSIITKRYKIPNIEGLDPGKQEILKYKYEDQVSSDLSRINNEKVKLCKAAYEDAKVQFEKDILLLRDIVKTAAVNIGLQVDYTYNPQKTKESFAALYTTRGSGERTMFLSQQQYTPQEMSDKVKNGDLKVLKSDKRYKRVFDNGEPKDVPQPDFEVIPSYLDMKLCLSGVLNNANLMVLEKNKKKPPTTISTEKNNILIDTSQSIFSEKEGFIQHLIRQFNSNPNDKKAEDKLHQELTTTLSQKFAILNYFNTKGAECSNLNKYIEAITKANLDKIIPQVTDEKKAAARLATIWNLKTTILKNLQDQDFKASAITKYDNENIINENTSKETIQQLMITELTSLGMNKDDIGFNAVQSAEQQYSLDNKQKNNNNKQVHDAVYQVMQNTNNEEISKGNLRFVKSNKRETNSNAFKGIGK